MGNYNPHAPLMLGQEWVPLRDENVEYAPAVNAFELGYGFTLATSRQVSQGRYYTHELPPQSTGYQTAVMAIYPQGTADQSGPIQQVIIPVSSGAITGSGASLNNASTVQEALMRGDTSYVQIGYSGSLDYLAVYFNTSAYPVLSGKRILNVSLLYSGYALDQDATTGLTVPFIDPDPSTSAITLRLINNSGSASIPYRPVRYANTGSLPDLSTTQTAQPEPAALDLGDVNLWVDPSTSPSTPVTGLTDCMPWRWVDLLRFEGGASGATRLNTQLTFQIPLTENGQNAFVQIDYMALRVQYCEESRIIVGGRIGPQGYGANAVTLRDLSYNTNPILAAGNYDLTMTQVSPGAADFGQGVGPQVAEQNGLRQLYEIPSLPGVEVDIPFPLSDHLGDTITTVASAVIPQLSLHASGSTLTEPHPYGRQVAAQVWGANTATQEIYDDITGVAATYPQVRFYARRFGDTTIPLTLTGVGSLSGSTTSITVADFDDLAEIIDGWREVTLRFASPPSMGAVSGFPAWTWSATGERAGNRWEILGAAAPAFTGVPGSLMTLAPTAYQLYGATYAPPSGSVVELTWMPQGIASPWVSGSTADAASDAVLIFSQDPPTITGFAGTAQTQSVVTYLDCAAADCCIPTGIAYTQLTWPQPGGTTLVEDSFTRTVVNGFGSPDVGTGPYTLTDVGTAYAVNGSTGLITPSVVGVPAAATLDVGSPDFDVVAQIGVSGNIVSTTTARANLVGRFTDASNQYVGLLQQSSAGAIVIGIQKTVAGVETVLATAAGTASIDGSGRVWARFLGYGPWLKFKVWSGERDDEPSMWNIEINDTSLTTGNRAGVSGRSGTLTGNVLAFDDLTITAPAYWFGAYELQRYDSVTGGDFETVMLATDIATTTFNDFEARVGVTSVYRIRSLNALNFAGQWSSYVSGSVASPGVTGGPCIGDGNSTLIFTSNADQTGANNAAYVMQWEGTPDETFGLPEADMVTFQPMYGRDGSIAFHGTERGLEQFNRVVQLHAAAIAPVRLADGQTIRDLAWASLPYVCVRDEISDRWFANIRIPNISVRNDRTIYMAAVEVTETTLTPYPVDP